MANEQPLTLTFACGRCDARLTIKSLLAGKKINCPKCHKKILVPKENDGVAVVPDDLSIVAPDGDGAKSAAPKETAPKNDSMADKPPPPKPAGKPADAAPSPETKAASEPTPPPPKPAVEPLPPSSPPPPADDAAAKAAVVAAETALNEKASLLEESRRELDKLRDQVAEQQRRETERDAELASLRSQESTARERMEAQAEQQREQTGQSAAQDQALTAARQKIADLERRLAQQARRDTAGSAVPSPSAMPPPVTEAAPDDEGPDPDDLIADLQQSTLRRGLRLSLAAHAVLLLVTSIGFIYWMIRGRPEPEPEPVVEAAAEAPRAPGAAAREEAAMALDTPPARRDSAPTQPVEPTRPRSSIEEAVESLPEPGETPEPSDISLDLDI